MRRKILDLRQIQEAALRQATVAPTDENYSESLERGTAEEERLNIISFFLDGREYAFEVSSAVEVLKLKTLTEVPKTPSFVLGILSVRGEMVPVIDLKGRFGESAQGGKAGRILVASVDDLKAGFIVERLSGVKEVPVSSIDGDLDGFDEPCRGFLKGLIRGASVIRLLDAGRLMEFRPDEA